MGGKNPVSNGTPVLSRDDLVPHDSRTRESADVSEHRGRTHGADAAGRPGREGRDADERRSTTDATNEPLSTIHAHAHAHERAYDGPSPGLFPHEKLDAYQLALQVVALSKNLAKEIPRGHRSIADHMLRASANTVLLLAEGANRRGAGDKRQRFVESRGECAEVAAAADLLLVLDIGQPTEAEKLKHLAGRVSSMPSRLGRGDRCCVSRRVRAEPAEPGLVPALPG
ncbi:MAG: four helix bundle protein [Deltaproteobacteria bacterium]|nr:four helix bundle protein [Deltaproteobacteria bacterium]